MLEEKKGRREEDQRVEMKCCGDRIYVTYFIVEVAVLARIQHDCCSKSTGR